mmetsp:Transcript_3711/g.9441  ORF Transcript_3711/g.9441 Transcript_3711/m.9441 type:complete len:205 (+) Transcript_3711:195-809(+)|eukprot:CAMPEP_0181104264 /NCGR_PEP_ID=MMETSP1071-20121207/15327_1 /TAXON_ID=35127 /ORGANISM="Thalassiosira sp., Strain NH16" /LENGTH=204 /DNA_ID=CAMNT_0023187435 /DNA_START=122 /DNA_END=736 /DNA_ORIENTATION=+
MSVSIQSPPNSKVLVSFGYSISPPPAPIAKRARVFFPSDAATPTFFPKERSVLESSFHHSHQVEEREQIALLASRPTCMRLKPRRALADVSRGRIYDTKKRVQLRVDQFPQLPFSFPPEEEKSADEPSNSKTIPDFPSFSLSPGISASSASPTDCSIQSNPVPVKTTLSKPAAVGQYVKLPAFQRGGVSRHSIQRRNSHVARSA